MSIECIDCGGTPVEAFGRCASCNAKNRKAERESKKVKVVKPMKKVSEKHADELTKYPNLRKQFLEYKMICEFDGCKEKSTQVHHCSKSATNFLNTDTWMAICATHHNFIEREMSAEERRVKGYLTD